MKKSKKFGKVLLILFMLGLIAVSILWVLDYEKNPQKYDAFVDSVKNTVTGESRFETESVSPLKKVSMHTPPEVLPPEYQYSLTVDSFDFPQDPGPLILCYSKDIGGDLYFPMLRSFGKTFTLRKLQLFSPDHTVSDLEGSFESSPEQRLVTVSAQALEPLEPGEYYLLADFQDEEGAVSRHSIGLVISLTNTFNSLQRGIINQADDSNWILNDLSSPRDITFTLVNLGDDPVRYVVLNNKDIGSDAYEINAQGNQVTLKSEYLSTLSLHSTIVFSFRLASGDTLDTLDRVVGTVDGDSLQRIRFLPESDTYSLSAGGDYTVPLDLGDAYRIILVKLADFGTDDGPIFEDRLSKQTASVHYDEDAAAVVLPEAELQALKAQKAPYCISVGYLLNESVFMQDDLLFYIAE